MMDEGDCPNGAVCRLCEKAFKIPEEDDEENLPRLLVCGHIYCTVCLLMIECDLVIKCPECEVEMTLPEGGVYGLQEDSRIIGLIYTAKMNKMKSVRQDKSKNRRRNRLQTFSENDSSTVDVEQPVDIQKFEKAVDEALAQAAENLAQLEYISENLTTSLSEQVKREKARMKMEIMQASEKAKCAIQMWKDAQLDQLSKLDTHFSNSQAAVCHVKERIKALEVAMRMASEVRRVPSLEQYCALDKVLKTLQAPVDNQSFHMDCPKMGTGGSCVFQSEVLSQSLSLTLKMEVGNSKHLAETPPINYIQSCPWKPPEDRNSSCIKRSENKLPSPPRRHQLSPWANSSSSHGAPPTPRPRQKLKGFSKNLTSALASPDVIIEEVLDDEPEHAALPPTGPELANDQWRIHKIRKKQFLGQRRNITQWVVVTHVVTPSHFYIQYVAEKKESEILSRKINRLCCQESCRFTSSDTLENGSMVFVRGKDGLWCRAQVVEMWQSGNEAVSTCVVTQLASLRVFFLDYGLTISIAIPSVKGTAESTLTAVHHHLKKVADSVTVQLRHFAPQAVRCSLKDLVPYDLTTGWSKEAQVEFCSVVGCAAVEMRPLGQDKDSLLVDLKKAPMDQSSDVPISVREYLVFIEVARFYSPVILGRRPLRYYPPVHPKIDTEVNAVVSHINSPSDFYIQLVDNIESLLLSTKLQDCYNAAKDKLNIYCPVIGEPCVARFNDKMWYRAQVTGHPCERRVEVYYVDFGNRKVLPFSDLKKIKDEFFVLPSMAIHCSLSDVVPVQEGSWSEECTTTFINLAHQKLLTVLVTENVPKIEPLPVKLFEGGLNEALTSISDVLVKEKLACFKEGIVSNATRPSTDDWAVWDPPLELAAAGDETDVIDQITPGKQDEDSEFKPHLKSLQELKDLKVTVTHVNSPSSFYVHFTQNDPQLKRICERVKQKCAQTEPQDLVWKTGSYCAAHINCVWERGQICGEVTSDNIAEVRRCDRGNTVKLHTSNLRPLPSSLIGSLVLECTLNDIRPAGGCTSWTDTACDLLSYYVIGASAVLTIKELTDERPVPVTLQCSNRMGQFISISDFLSSEGLALRERKPRDAVCQHALETDAPSPGSESHTAGVEENSLVSLTSLPGSTRTIPKPAPRSFMSAEKVQTPSYLPPELPRLGLAKINVTAVGDSGVIYARTPRAESQLEPLRERIQQSMKTLPRHKPYTWKSVLGCAVMGSDMLWYRGQRLEMLGGYVKVHYVDYGMVENIPAVHVYPMLLCDDVPQLCLPCQLLGVNPIGEKWHQDAVALLREILVNRSVDMQVVELPADPKGTFTVEIFLDGLNLSKILCHFQHACMDMTVLPSKEFSVMSAGPVLDEWDINTEGLVEPEEAVLGSFVNPNLPEAGERFKIRVKHLQTPNEVFLWPLEEAVDEEVDGETLDEALMRINADINSLPRLTNFPCGGPCLAEYSDGKYYRAKLLNITSVDPVTVLVQHVDFGSDDSLPSTKLRQMPAELLQFSSQALKVKVAGFKAATIRRQEDMLPYSPQWSVKAVMEMIDLLHNNITASVVACEPQLTVLLYNKDGELVHLPLVESGLAEFE